MPYGKDMAVQQFIDSLKLRQLLCFERILMKEEMSEKEESLLEMVQNRITLLYNT